MSTGGGHFMKVGGLSTGKEEYENTAAENLENQE